MTSTIKTIEDHRAALTQAQKEASQNALSLQSREVLLMEALLQKKSRQEQNYT